MTEFFRKAREIRAFMGGQVAGLFLKSSAVGLLIFGIESSFILVLQGFIRAVGLVNDSNLQLPDWFPRSLGVSVALLGVFGLLRGLAYFLRSYLGGIIHQAFIRLQRSRIASYALSHADEVSIHEVVTVFADRVNQSGSVLNGVSVLVLTLTSSTLLFFLGLKLAPLEMLLGISLLFVAVFPLRYLNSLIQAAASGLVKESEAANRALLQGVKHHVFLKIYNLLEREEGRALSSLRSYERLYHRYYLVSSFKFAFPLTIGVLVICAITYVSVAYIHTPAIQLVSFFYVFIRLAQGASDVNSSLSDIRLQMPSFRELFGWYQRYLAHQGSKPASSSVKAPPEKEFSAAVDREGIRVEVNGLSFGYPKQAPLFSGLNLGVGKGEVLVIQGESGVGKSTLLSLMLGLQSPTAGEIKVSGFPLEEVRPILSRFIGYVGPEPHLIPGSVRENLLYGHETPQLVTDGDLWAALRQARIESDVKSLPGGLSEALQEITQLSTGQKQRLAIARAILRRPAWLVLDEASANLDAVTEEGFIDSLQTLLPGLTTVVISHKPSFNRIATQHLQLKR